MIKIDFYIRYRTNFGEAVFVTGNLPVLCNEIHSHALPMTYLNDDFWHVSIKAETHNIELIEYQYSVSRPDNTERKLSQKYNLKPPASKNSIVVDEWLDRHAAGEVFFSAPFSKVFYKQHKQARQKKSSFTHIFKIKAPLIQAEDSICLTGDSKELGNWNPKGGIILQKEGDWWTGYVDLSAASLPLTYKYGIFNSKKKEFVQFESGENRVLYVNYTDEDETIVNDGFVRLSYHNWKGAGISIPVFSLRTRDSFGIGEFSDLKPLADWASETGLKLIQVLPVNDTIATHSWKDSYPYAAISAFALNPVYINLQRIGGKKNAGIIKALEKKRKQLNELPEVDFETVLQFKINTLRELYDLHPEGFLKEEEYKIFFDENKQWLTPYAAFCYLRDKYATAHFHSWRTFATYKEEEVEKLCAPKSKQFKEIAFWYFVQYHLHIQLKDAVRHAHKKGIILKGDIPIGIYRYGCDAWTNPSYFNMDQQAGAPPDDFAIKGQNWGFPTYNWAKMQEDNFAWWRLRFKQMGHYFDAFRIDHILGFFRIWSIPLHSVEGILGRFVPAIPLRLEDFTDRGIPFNQTRLCKPYITDEILEQEFGVHVHFVKTVFLTNNEEGQYTLKEEFNTQRKVTIYFEKQEEAEEAQLLQKGLFNLIANVILLEEEQAEGAFHFRINMQHTTSFYNLQEAYKESMEDLYIDYFYRRQNSEWKKEALKKLPDLKDATDMMICGEDLGMVPECVPEVMRELGILSLEIQRMPKDSSVAFFNSKRASYLSVITPSTHDMSTVRAWWEEDRQRTQQFYNTVLEEHGEAPFFCASWINTAIVMQHLYSPAMWSIFQWQDLIGMNEELRRSVPQEERINVPAISEFYWRYRMHMPIEDLLKQKSLNHHLKEMIINSGRG